jgi:hypothetical protein
VPHFECAACRALLYSAAKPADLISNECPECGFVFEPAGQEAEFALPQGDRVVAAL